MALLKPTERMDVWPGGTEPTVRHFIRHHEIDAGLYLSMLSWCVHMIGREMHRYGGWGANATEFWFDRPEDAFAFVMQFQRSETTDDPDAA